MSTHWSAAAAIVSATAFALPVAAEGAVSSLELCVPKRAGSALLTPRHGRCGHGYALTAVGAQGREGRQGTPGVEGRPGAEGQPGADGPEGRAAPAQFGAAEAAALKALLPYVRFVTSGIDGRPTIQFTGVNVQIVDGEGRTETTNGTGNLIVGYDENAEHHAQSGSHDVILGEEQSYTSYAALLVGQADSVAAPFGVAFGAENTVDARLSAVTGGQGNLAGGLVSSITGGTANSTSSHKGSVGAVVSGGSANSAEEETATVSGGFGNTAAGSDTWVGGGAENVSGSGSPLTPVAFTSVAGGRKNSAQAEYASIFGGKELAAHTAYEAIP